jgi:hypothetical protein
LDNLVGGATVGSIASATDIAKASEPEAKTITGTPSKPTVAKKEPAKPVNVAKPANPA